MLSDRQLAESRQFRRCRIRCSLCRFGPSCSRSEESCRVVGDAARGGAGGHRGHGQNGRARRRQARQAMTARATRTPRTVMEWVRQYRRRRRAKLGSEERFGLHARRLFRVSEFVRHKGWKLAELEEALGAVADEPVCGSDAANATRIGGRYDQPGTRGRDLRPPASGRRCIDCGSLLPPYRQRRGRCEPCRRRRARQTARLRMRRQRAKVDAGKVPQKPTESCSRPRSGPQKARSPCPPGARSPSA